MKSVVLVKQVQEAPSISGTPGAAGTVANDSQNVVNPYDSFAIEEGLQQRDKVGGELIAMTLGAETAVEVLREALAMGANGAVHVHDAAFESLDAAGAGKALAQAVEKIGDVDLVFAGKLTMDNNTALTAPALARHLGFSLLTEVFQVVEIDADGRSVTVERLLDGGRQVVKAKLPAVIAVTKDINEPRFASLLGIRKAARAPITVWSAEDLGGAPSVSTEVVARTLPAARPEGELFQGEADEVVNQLVEKLVQSKLI